MNTNRGPRTMTSTAIGTAAALVLALGAVALPAPAQAGGSVSFGVSIGGHRHHYRPYRHRHVRPYFGFHVHPHFYPRHYVYTAPLIVTPPEPTVYIERAAPQPSPAPAASAPQAGTHWYYCAASDAYYPYVRECPGGWEAVPAQPPR